MSNHSIFDTLSRLSPQVGVEGIWAVFWIFFFISIGIAFWFIYGRIKEQRDYEGDAICKMRITVMNKYTLEGNLSKNDSFDDDKLVQFKEQKDLKPLIGVVEKLIKNHQLYIYNFKVTDDTEATDDFAEKTRIISPAKIESLEYSWQSQKGKRLFEKFFLTSEKRNNCVFYSTTKRITIYDEDGHEEDWWIASPMPMVEAKTYLTMKDSPFPDAPIHMINITEMKSMTGVAEHSSASTTLNKALSYNDHLVRERDDYEELYKKQLKKTEDVSMEKNDIEEELAQHPYIDTGREETKLSLHDFTWAIVGAMAGGFGAVMLPLLFPAMNLVLTQFGGIALGLLITGIIFKYFVESKKQVTTKRIDAE